MLQPDGTYHLANGATEMGNGTITSMRQVAASILNTTASRVDIINADTDRTPYDTGTFGSTGTSVATLAVSKAAEALKESLLDIASMLTKVPAPECRIEKDRVQCGNRSVTLKDLHATSPFRDKLHVSRKAYNSPRSTAFQVHGFRIAVHRVTGEIRILQSVQAFDAGTILNPMQARGQMEGGIAQGIGTSLFERMVLDNTGAVINPTFRNYRIPAFADIPRSEIYFADTCDRYGPLGAKPIGEAPIIPIAAALGNALADATGIRFDSLPFSADCIFAQLNQLQ